MMPDIKLRQLRYFVLVAELESYHAAAQRAARSQPAISLAIKELEQRLGERLFEHGRKTELTAFGRHCFPLAKALLDHHARAMRQMADTAERRVGRVAVASVPSFASQRLPAILDTFAKRHPRIDMTVEDDTALNVQRRVLQGHVDFGIGSLWELDSNLAFTPLLQDQMGLVCRRDHPRRPFLGDADAPAPEHYACA